jgi:imidazolonepropionase-like amidohydrolase
MKRTRSIFSLIIFLFIQSLPSISAQPQNPSPANTVIAFMEVNVVPMNKEGVLNSQTVIIRDGRIAEIGSAAKVRVPKEAVKIDGRGKYLMPGLMDMHVHMFPDDRVWFLYLANGVTTARIMAGSAKSLKLREQIAGGETLGPRIYTCGAFLLGLKDAEVTRRAVAQQASDGYDCVKIYNTFDWTAEAYQALIETAKKHKIAAVGHLPINLPIEAGLVAGRQTVEHTEQFLYAYFFKSQNRFDESRIAHLAKLLKDAGIAVDATLFVYRAIALMADDKEFQKLASDPRLQYLPKAIREQWVDNNSYRKRFKADAVPFFNKSSGFLKTITRSLHSSGIQILLGTDASPDQPFMFPGFSIHDELRELVDAGLTPFQALQAGTLKAAEVLNKAQEVGTIEVNKRADLILLEKNPLIDISHLKQPVGVMSHGKWLSKPEIEKRLAEIATYYQTN